MLLESKTIIFYREKLAMADLTVNHLQKNWHKKVPLHLSSQQ